ncbi:C40 family peptidase [Marvinbryantia formatexigens]
MNANWETNIIASNAAWLGQLSGTYGISFSCDFGSLCSRVEAEFAQTLSDPENFHASNWKDVFAVFVYELKQRTGSASISEDSYALLLEIFTEMNEPEHSADGEAGPDISEVFVEEYPIEEALAEIDAQEELLLAGWNTGTGTLEEFMRESIKERAEQKREALREEKQAQMDRARYEKWLRLRQESVLQTDDQSEQSYLVSELVPAAAADYVRRNGIGSAGAAEIESYASTQCLQLCAIASAAPQIVRAAVGDDVSEARVRIVTAAYSLVGKVGYFWGGKSFVFGWDDRWGTPAKVTADGSTSTGMTRGYGLDCSGFTLYCYYNGLGGSDAGIGGHTTSQWNASVMVDQINAQPGDLVFYGGPERGDMNHVGLVVGKSADGGLIVAHCSSSQNGVVVGEAWSSGFRYVRTVPGLQ